MSAESDGTTTTTRSAARFVNAHFLLSPATIWREKRVQRSSRAKAGPEVQLARDEEPVV